MATDNQSPELQPLSGAVRKQVDGMLDEIRKLSNKGHKVTSLLEHIGNAARALEDKEKPLSTLDMMTIENEVLLAKKRVEYSTSYKPTLHAIYQLVWTAIWVFFVIPHRFNLYKFFGASTSVYTAIIGAISGALGASLFALGGLYKHRIHLDLDDKFTMWYILKPVVGGLMGGFVGLMSSILVTGLGGHEVSTPALIIVSAFGGMHEAWAMGLFQKVTGKALGSNNPSFGAGTNTTINGQ